MCGIGGLNDVLVRTHSATEDTKISSKKLRFFSLAVILPSESEWDAVRKDDCREFRLVREVPCNNQSADSLRRGHVGRNVWHRRQNWSVAGS